MIKHLKLDDDIKSKLKPTFLSILNRIYSSSSGLEDMTLENDAGSLVASDNFVFYKPELENEYNMYKFFHKHYPTPNKQGVNFKKFDMDLDLYINNLLSLCSVYNDKAYCLVDTRIYLDRVFNNSIMHKMFPPQLACDNIKIEFEIKFDTSLSGVFYVFCQYINGKLVIKNKSDVYKFFTKFINNIKERCNIPNEINLNHMTPEEEFKENTLLLKMLVI